MKKQKIKKDLKITKNMTFNEIIEKNPDAIMVLFEKGMHCIGCGMAGFETLEQGALVHGLDPDELVNELNGESSFEKDFGENKTHKDKPDNKLKERKKSNGRKK